MTTQTLAAVAACAGLAAAASAQPVGTATYSFAFGSPTGPNSIGLGFGQSIMVYVNVWITPGIGQPIGNPPGTVAGLSSGAFSISQNSGLGTWSQSSLTLDRPYNAPLGTSPGSAVFGGVNGVAWGMGPLLQLPHPSPSNPDTVWSGQFTMGPTGHIRLIFTGLGPTTVFYGGPIPSIALYNSVGTAAVINPAPTTAALLALAGLTAARRSRRTHARGVTP